jgi:hypothetical protein
MNTDRWTKFGLVFAIGLFAGLALSGPPILKLQEQVQEDIAVSKQSNQALIACRDRAAGSTVLLDLHNTSSAYSPAPDDPRLISGKFAGNAPLWDIPGHVVPRVLNSAPGALWGYYDKDGKFQGWRVPEKED